jgi:hypothetical protein
MISISVASKLYDSGYPSETESLELSSLIKACGYDLRSISFHSDGRVIAKSGARSKHPKCLFTGESIEDAVAKLWIKLRGNEKA